MNERIGRLYQSSRKAVLVLVTIAAVPSSAQDMKPLSALLAKSISASARKTVAVLDFTDLQGNVTELGRFLAEEFSGDLVSDAKGFEVIDRTHLKSILQEHRLAATGLIDPQTARKLGEIAGVDALVTGTITPLGDSIRLSAKVLDTTTAKMLGASTAEIPRTRAIEELLGRGVGGAIAPGAAGTGTSLATPPATISPVSAADNEFLFAVRSCRIKGQDVACVVAITNKDENRRFLRVCCWGGAGGSSTLVDDLGNEYHPQRMDLGASRAEQWLEPDLPINMSATFQKIDPKASRATLMITYEFTDSRGERQRGLNRVVLRSIMLQR
jgi:TolB-like protein